MLIDGLLYMADAASSTTSEASTDYIDTLAAAHDYVGKEVVFKVGTAFVAGAGAPTATFQLQTSNSSSFLDSSTTTLAASSAMLAAALTINSFAYRVRIPVGAKRYIRGYKVVDSGAEAKRFNAGTWSCFIAEDVDVLLDHTQ